MSTWNGQRQEAEAAPKHRTRAPNDWLAPALTPQVPPAIAARRILSPTVRPADILTLQRAVGNRAVQRLLAKRADDFGPRDANGVAPEAELAVNRASSSVGAPLPAAVRGRFESSFGADLSDVRVHNGMESAEAAEAVGAKAYTLGQDIHFGAEYYAPDDEAGIHLLAHEVAHTLQNRGGTPALQTKLEVSKPDDEAEIEADRAADAIVTGTQPGVGRTATAIYRDTDPSAAKAPAPSQTPAPATPGPAVGTNAEPARVPLTSSIQATAYAFEADADWNTGSQAARADFAATKVDGKTAFFQPVKLGIKSGRFIFQIIVTVDNEATQAYSWRCDAAEKTGLTRLDPLGALTLSTGGANDVVLGGLQGNQSQLPSSNPYVQVTAQIGAPTTSTTHTPSYNQPQGSVGVTDTSGAGTEGNSTRGIGITFGVQHTPPVDQRQQSPATPVSNATFTADIDFKGAQPAAEAPKEAPKIDVPDLTYEVHFANDSQTISSAELAKLLEWEHTELPKYSGLREAIQSGQVRVHLTGRASVRGKDASHNFTLSQNRNEAVRIALQGMASATGGGRTKGGLLGGEAVLIDPVADGDFHDPKPADMDQDRVVQIFIQGSDASSALSRQQNASATPPTPTKTQ